jgi:hypothetical protein
MWLNGLSWYWFNKENFDVAFLANHDSYMQKPIVVECSGKNPISRLQMKINNSPILAYCKLNEYDKLFEIILV